MDVERIPGPGDSDPIEFVSNGGFRATVALEDWPLLEATATVRRTTPTQGPWPGRVVAIERARFLVAQWQLASGEVRQWRVFSTLEDGLVTGGEMPVRQGANQWLARVIEHHGAVRVRVEFTIQSGARRQRDFFRRGELSGYGRRLPGGRVALYRLNDQPEAPLSGLENGDT